MYVPVLAGIANGILAIGAAARATAADLKVAAEAARENNEASAGMTSSGGAASTMGASSGGGTTAQGLTLAIRQQQGRL